jgi:zinc protease
MYNYYTGTPDYLTQDLARYEKLTTADVQRVARQYLVGKNKVVLTVVPQGKKELAVSGGAD